MGDWGQGDVWWEDRACSLPLPLGPSPYLGPVSPTLQRPGEQPPTPSPETPIYRAWRWGRGWAWCSGKSQDRAARKQGRGTPRRGAGKPQSCFCCPARQAACWGRPLGLSGQGPSEWESDSPVPEGPKVPKASSGDGQRLRGTGHMPGTVGVPSSERIEPCSHSPVRKRRYPHCHSKDPEAWGGWSPAHSHTAPKWQGQDLDPGSLLHTPGPAGPFFLVLESPGLKEACCSAASGGGSSNGYYYCHRHSY